MQSTVQGSRRRLAQVMINMREILNQGQCQKSSIQAPTCYKARACCRSIRNPTWRTRSRTGLLIFRFWCEKLRECAASSRVFRRLVFGMGAAPRRSLPSLAWTFGQLLPADGWRTVFALKFHDILVMISWSNSLQRFKSVASMVQEIHEWAAHISPPPLSSPHNYGNQKKVIQSEVKHKFFLFRQWDDLLDHAWKYLGDNDLNFPHLLYNFKFVIP